MSIYTYSLKSFRQNMGKGLIFMIVLSVTLMSLVLNIVSSIYNTRYEEIVAVNSDAHVRFPYLTDEQAKLISSQETVLWSDLRLDLRSFGVIPGSDNGIGIVCCQNIGTVAGIELAKGKAPAMENEIAIAPHTAKALGLECRVGEEFTLTVQNTDGSTNLHSLVITGILRDMKYYAAANTHVICVSKAFMQSYGSFALEYGRDAQEGLDSRALYVRFKDGSAVKESAEALAQLVGSDGADIQYNYAYLSLNTYSTDVIVMVALALAILLATGAIVIYNAFNIVVTKRIRQFGLLTLIGASKQQIKICVYLDALLSAAIALPIGLLLGSAIVYFSLPMLCVIMDGMNIAFYASFWSYALTVVMTGAMVFIGVVRPARKAANITPVDAVKFSPAPEKAKKRREYGDVYLPVLAKLNMDRNRSRMVSTVLALSCGGVLLLVVSTLGFAMLNGLDGLVSGTLAGDVMIMAGSKDGNSYVHPTEIQLTQPVMEAIKEIGGVKKVSAFTAQGYSTATDFDLDTMGTVVGVQADALAELMAVVAQGSSDAAQLTVVDDVINVLAVNNNSTYAGQVKRHVYEVGELIPCYLVDSLDGYQITGATAVFRVMGVIDAKDVSAQAISVGLGTLPKLIVPQNVFYECGFEEGYKSANVYIDADKHDEALLALDAALDACDQLYFESLMELKNERKRQAVGIIVLIFMAIFIIATIGILNLISSVFVGIEQRKKELGMLAALGLSKKGMKKLLTYESVRISYLSILFSLVFGLGMGYGFYGFLKAIGADYLRYTVPVIPIAILLAAYTLIPLLITRVAIRRISKSTILELLGQWD